MTLAMIICLVTIHYLLHLEALRQGKFLLPHRQYQPFPLYPNVYAPWSTVHAIVSSLSSLETLTTRNPLRLSSAKTSLSMGTVHSLRS